MLWAAKFLAKLLVGFLGILLAFSPEVFYSVYETGGTRWGMSALDDQHGEIQAVDGRAEGVDDAVGHLHPMRGPRRGRDGRPRP